VEAASDQRRFFVPCPHCHHSSISGGRKPVNFDDGGRRRLRCEGCGVVIEERYKPCDARSRRMARDEPDGRVPGISPERALLAVDDVVGARREVPDGEEGPTR
jgi:hypothetical protein